MVDTFSREKRSWIMGRVHAEDTTPEIIVRSTVHRLGYRFRLHRKDLPGKPDLVFPSRGKVIFVHGCFWHGHKCRRGAREPKSNSDYWKEKITRNMKRDRAHLKELKKQGWGVLVVWECEVREEKKLRSTLKNFLDNY